VPSLRMAWWKIAPPIWAASSSTKR
jgi:hypothetical protein